MLCTRKAQLYLGVWARVKRRLWRLMLRFIINFLNSSGEFRGDPRGESLGEILGEPPGEPALDLGMSLMSLVNLWSCGISSTSDSSELSVHSSLMADSRVRDWSQCSPGPQLVQKKKFKHSSTDLSEAWLFSCLFRGSYCLGSCPRVHMFEQILGLSLVAVHIEAWSEFYLYWKPLSSVHVEIISTAVRGEKNPQTLTFMYSLCLPPSCTLCLHYC